jgi:hypothetical protein
MGLLDNMDDPATMGLLSLGMRLMSTPGKFGPAFGTAGLGALGDIQGMQQAALKKKLVESQIADAAAQAKQREAQAAEMQRKLMEQQRIQSLIQQAVTTPVNPVDANSVSGITGPRPSALGVVGQRKPIDFQGLIAAGVPHEVVKALADSQDYGKAKVARTVEIKGPDGKPATIQLDEFGKPVGQNLPKWVAPHFANLGDKVQAIDPTEAPSGANWAVGQSPDNKASVGAQYANAAATREAAATQAAAVRDAAKIERDKNSEMKLADDYRAQSKLFGETKNAYEQVKSVLPTATSSPYSTLAAATKFMKIIDPGSVVRESELGMALAATGALDRASNYLNTLQKGKVLTTQQAADLASTVEKIYGAAKKVQQQVDANYKNVAKTYGLRPEVIIQDFGQSGGLKDIGGGFSLKE